MAAGSTQAHQRCFQTILDLEERHFFAERAELCDRYEHLRESHFVGVLHGHDLPDLLGLEQLTKLLSLLVRLRCGHAELLTAMVQVVKE